MAHHKQHLQLQEPQKTDEFDCNKYYLMSKCGNTKNMAHYAIAECVTDVKFMKKIISE